MAKRKTSIKWSSAGIGATVSLIVALLVIWWRSTSVAVKGNLIFWKPEAEDQEVKIWQVRTDGTTQQAIRTPVAALPSNKTNPVPLNGLLGVSSGETKTIDGTKVIGLLDGADGQSTAIWVERKFVTTRKPKA